MTFTTPFTAVTGAVITASGHNTSVRDNLLHLRGLLPDPTGTGLPLVSSSTSAAAFGTVPLGGLAAGSVTTTTVVDHSLTAVKLHAVDAPADDEVYTYNSSNGFAEWQSVAQLTTTTPLAAASLASNAVTVAKLDAQDSPADDEVLTYNSTTGQMEWQAVSGLSNSVPSGLVAMFRTNAAIAAGWSRETNLDGRMPVGAGTTFGVTYTEATNYGSSWDHAHSITGSISINANTSVGNMNEGGGANHEFASTGHNHGIGGGYGVSTAAWVIPSRAYVFAIKS